MMEPISLYIHIPFCGSKCAYCDFYSIKTNNDTIKNYVDELIIKIKEYSKIYKRKLKTIYFGGGTPSYIGTTNLIKILNSITNSFDTLQNAEITLECNPNNLNLLDFNLLRKYGFNRISIGLQSSNEKELKILSRKHTKEDVTNMINAARKSGIDNISVDVMLCIPKQTKDSLNDTIQFCINNKVNHISGYILKIEKNTKFYNIKDTLDLKDDDTQAEFYELFVDELSKNGYIQYEISNFSKPSYESKHNLTYWRDEEYLGLGPSAHSFIEGKRYYFNRNFNEFYNNKLIYDTIGGDKEEFVMLSLRLNEGLIFKKFENKYHISFPKEFINRALLLEKQNLLKITNKNIYLTTKGMLVSNKVISYLLDFI